MGIPSILAAALLEGVDAVKSPEGINVDPVVLIVGIVVSAVVGYLSIALFKWLLKTDKTYIFVIYAGVMGVIITTISVIELATGNIISFV